MHREQGPDLCIARPLPAGAGLHRGDGGDELGTATRDEPGSSQHDPPFPSLGLDTQVLQERQQDLHVAEGGHVRQVDRLGGQEGRGHDRQSGVLGPRDADRPLQSRAAATGDAEGLADAFDIGAI